MIMYLSSLIRRYSNNIKCLMHVPDFITLRWTVAERCLVLHLVQSHHSHLYAIINGSVVRIAKWNSLVMSMDVGQLCHGTVTFIDDH